IEFINSTGSAQTYYLRAFPKGGVFIRNAYDLWLKVGANSPATPYCPGEYERNDEVNAAYEFDFKAQPQLAGAIMCGLEEDWYKVSLNAGSEYRLAAFFDSTSSFDIDLKVHDESGAEVAASASTENDEIFTFTPASTGTYFIGGKQAAA